MQPGVDSGRRRSWLGWARRDARATSPRLFGFRLLVSLLLCLLPALTWSTEINSSRPRTALVIGNGQYEAVGNLKNPLHDEQDMCNALVALGFSTSCHVNVRTRGELRAMIEDFIEALPDDSVILVYYAGHAVQVNGENYLIPTGAQLRTESAVVTESVNLSFLMHQLQIVHSFLNVVILDACRDNPVAAGTTSLPKGLAQVTPPDRTEVFYATAADETALDGIGRNGVLTKNILAHIREAGTVDDLFNQVSIGVQRDTEAMGRVQKPALYKTFNGQFCLVRCTDLEELQAQKQRSDAKVEELKASLAAGDQKAKAELDREKAKNDELTRKLQKQERERPPDIPPAG